MIYNLSGSQTYGGAISGSGGLTLSGNGTLLLSGSNNYTGHTTVNSGALEVTNTGALSHYTSGTRHRELWQMLALSVGTSWTVNNVGSLLTTNSGNFSPGSAVGLDTSNGNFTYGTISGNMGLTKLGSNTLTLTGNNTYAGSTTVSMGTLAIVSTAALPGYLAPSMLTVGNSADLTLSVGGTGWAATDVGNLLSANGSGFAPGSTLGIDTTNVSGSLAFGRDCRKYGADEAGQ